MGRKNRLSPALAHQGRPFLKKLHEDGGEGRLGCLPGGGAYSHPCIYSRRLLTTFRFPTVNLVQGIVVSGEGRITARPRFPVDSAPYKMSELGHPPYRL